MAPWPNCSVYHRVTEYTEIFLVNSMAMQYAIVIPAYNEAATIRGLVEACLQQSDKVIVVDDGSGDNTVEVLSGLKIQLLRNGTNQGKAASLWRGLAHARDHFAVDTVITLDGDGQHRPKDIPGLISAVEQFNDYVIIGARLLNQENAPKARLYANKVADFWVSWAAGQRIRDTQSGFRAYPLGLLDVVQVPHGKGRGFVFESEILIEAVRNGYACKSVPIKSLYISGARASHFRPVADIMRIVLMVAWKLVKKGLYLQGLWRVLIDTDQSVVVN